MPIWAHDLGFHYERNGAYVLAFSEEEAVVLEELLKRGRENGVEGCRVISGEQARAAEPKLSAGVTAALEDARKRHLRSIWARFLCRRERRRERGSFRFPQSA